MPWKRMLAYITGSVNEDLLCRMYGTHRPPAARARNGRLRQLAAVGECGGSCSLDFGGVSSGTSRAMSKISPSVKAEILWGTIPAWAKDEILKNVFCVKCRSSVEIVDYTKKERRGDLILKGRCGVCGHEVVRVVETSEAPPPNN
jgi:hypothetical protein